MKAWVWLGAAGGLVGQWIVQHALGVHLAPPWEAIAPGAAIFGAAFMLSWAAEVAQLEIPPTLAFAALALIAVLPEYAVDIYFAWTAAVRPEYVAYAAANMTGANRLLIGVGWPVILVAFWLKTRKTEVALEPEHKIELQALALATVYSFLIPLKRTLTVMDTVVLLAIFVWYIARATRAHKIEPELEGPSLVIGQAPVVVRRLVTVGLFLLAGYTIWIAAEPFAEGLLNTGRQFGIEEFILVQWLAPLASESPEFIVAILFALRANPGASFGTLVSSKVNQWTLLISMLPLAFSIHLGRVGTMALDGRQVEEIFLTAAQSLFALVALLDLKFSMVEGALLFVLFSTQLCFPDPVFRLGYAWAYIVLAGLWLAVSPHRRGALGTFWRREPAR